MKSWKYAAARAKMIKKEVKTRRRAVMKKLREEAAEDKAKEAGNDASPDVEESDQDDEEMPAANAMVVGNPGVSEDVLQRALMGVMTRWMASAATAMRGGSGSAAGCDMRGTFCDHYGGQGHAATNCWTRTRENEGRGGKLPGREARTMVDSDSPNIDKCEIYMLYKFGDNNWGSFLF